MKDCRDCKYWKKGYDNKRSNEECTHEETEFHNAAFNRDGYGNCGPRARYFEPRNPVKVVPPQILRQEPLTAPAALATLMGTPSNQSYVGLPVIVQPKVVTHAQRPSWLLRLWHRLCRMIKPVAAPKPDFSKHVPEQWK